MAKLDIWIAAGLSLIAGIIYYPFARIGLDPHHDGIMLKPALDVLSGQALYRDTFSQYGPLTTYLQAAALAVQPTLLSLRVLTVLATAASLFFFHLSWRVLLPRSLCVVASVMFVASALFFDPEFPMLPWSSVLALFFQSLAFFSLMRIVAGPAHAGWPWLLGLACACTVWCRQTVGICLTLSVAAAAIALQVTGWRGYAPFTRTLWLKACAAFGVVSLLFIGRLALEGALPAWWEQTILWPKRWAAGYNEAIFWVNARAIIYPREAGILVATLVLSFLPAILRRRWAGIPGWADLAWLAVLAIIYLTFARPYVAPSLALFLGGWNAVIILVLVGQAVGVIMRAWRSRPTPLDPEYHAAGALCAVALASVVQIYPIPEPNHVYWALAPGIGVLFYAAYRWLRLPAGTCSVAFLLLLVPAIYSKCRWGNYTLTQPTVTLADPAVLRGMRVKPPLGAALAHAYALLQPVLRDNPDQPVILYGDDALYLAWFANLENPSPYYVNWRDLPSPADRQKRLEYVFRAKPVILLQGTGARELQYVPVDYEISAPEPLLDLRIALPGHLRPPAAAGDGK